MEFKSIEFSKNHLLKKDSSENSLKKKSQNEVLGLEEISCNSLLSEPLADRVLVSEFLDDSSLDDFKSNLE